MCVIVSDAVRANTLTRRASDAEVEATIKTWLKHAPERIKNNQSTPRLSTTTHNTRQLVSPSNTPTNTRVASGVKRALASSRGLVENDDDENVFPLPKVQCRGALGSDRI